MKPLLEFDGDDVESVRAAFHYTNRELAEIFGKSERTIYRWKVNGAPPHIALVLDAMTARRYRRAAYREKLAKRLLDRIPPSRRDGNRYA